MLSNHFLCNLSAVHFYVLLWSRRDLNKKDCLKIISFRQIISFPSKCTTNPTNNRKFPFSGELTKEKDKYKQIASELDVTFADLAGY